MSSRNSPQAIIRQNEKLTAALGCLMFSVAICATPAIIGLILLIVASIAGSGGALWAPCAILWGKYITGISVGIPLGILLGICAWGIIETARDKREAKKNP